MAGATAPVPRRGDRPLRPGTASSVRILDVETGAVAEVHRSAHRLLEAPNWSLDGGSLILNADGGLWRLPLREEAGTPTAGPLEPISLDGAPALNNDHVLDPDGEHIHLTGRDGHLHRASLAGGAVTRTTVAPPTPTLRHYLHGVSPDGTRLSLVGLDPAKGWDADAVLYTIAVDGADYRRLGELHGHSDGPEYTPDGEWILLNTETFDGHAQLARIRPDGAGLEQLTTDARVNWFPHPGPDGRVVYLSYPEGTEGHPADLPVELRMLGEDGAAPRILSAFLGGQGTINVPSWHPEGGRLAFVAYPEE